MRYSSARRYPITRMKKELQAKNQERVLDISLGTAAGILALAFAGGMFWGYVGGKSFSKR
jgi:hypothetical protein